MIILIKVPIYNTTFICMCNWILNNAKVDIVWWKKFLFLFKVFIIFLLSFFYFYYCILTYIKIAYIYTYVCI